MCDQDSKGCERELQSDVQSRDVSSEAAAFCQETASHLSSGVSSNLSLPDHGHGPAVPRGDGPGGGPGRWRDALTLANTAVVYTAVCMVLRAGGEARPGRRMHTAPSCLQSRGQRATGDAGLLFSGRDGHAREAAGPSHLRIPGSGDHQELRPGQRPSIGALPVPRSQQQPQDADDGECGAVFPAVAHVPSAHSPSHNTSNGSVPHSLTHPRTHSHTPVHSKH